MGVFRKPDAKNQEEKDNLPSSRIYYEFGIKY